MGVREGVWEGGGLGVYVQGGEGRARVCGLLGEPGGGGGRLGARHGKGEWGDRESRRGLTVHGYCPRARVRRARHAGVSPQLPAGSPAACKPRRRRRSPSPRAGGWASI